MSAPTPPPPPPTLPPTHPRVRIPKSARRLRIARIVKLYVLARARVWPSALDRRTVSDVTIVLVHALVLFLVLVIGLVLVLALVIGTVMCSTSYPGCVWGKHPTNELLVFFRFARGGAVSEGRSAGGPLVVHGLLT